MWNIERKKDVPDNLKIRERKCKKQMWIWGRGNISNEQKTTQKYIKAAVGWPRRLHNYFHKSIDRARKNRPAFSEQTSVEEKGHFQVEETGSSLWNRKWRRWCPFLTVCPVRQPSRSHRQFFFFSNALSLILTNTKVNNFISFFFSFLFKRLCGTASIFGYLSLPMFFLQRYIQYG